MKLFKDKRYVIVSNWAYPFGGGEEFLYQTMKWADNLGMKCFWICFSKNNKPFTQLEIDNHPHGTIIKVPNGFNSDNLYNWLKLLKPDLVHHQGNMRKQFYDVCESLRIHFVSGYHFWTGAFILDPEHRNIDILEHAKKHKKDDEIDYLIDKPFCTLYTATPFVSDCIEAVTNHKITKYIYASSDYNKCKLQNMNNIYTNKYVSIINIHALKGGELVPYLIKNLPNIPFLVVRTEFNSDTLDEEIRNAIQERNNTPGAEKCLYMERVADPTLIYSQTRIMLVPTLVDETFCRVVNESMMNGIPVITTGQGNVKYLVGESCPIIPFKNFELWKKTVDQLYFDESLLNHYSKQVLEKYNDFSEEKAERLFKNVMQDALLKSKEMNVMLFSPWCDQGLGIQSRNYAKILENSLYNVSVFALAPYNGKTCIEMQRNPEEWIIDSIFYSENNREKVRDDEIIEFIYKHNIGKCLLPETCYFRVFEVAQLMRSQGVKCYAIPNIEIVKKAEVYKHRYFYKILCNNHLCLNQFSKHSFKNIEYVGYAPQDEAIFQRPTVLKHDTILDISDNITTIKTRKTSNNSSFVSDNTSLISTSSEQSLLEEYTDLSEVNLDNPNYTSRSKSKKKVVKDVIRYLFIGGMNAINRKNMLFILEAFEIAYRQNTNMHLTCTIQKFNANEELERHKVEGYLNHPGITIIRDHLSYTDIINLYYTHHISIQVSKHEGLGLGFFEAISTGTPVITLDTAPHNEIIHHNVNGWTIPCYYKPMLDNTDSLLESAYFEPKLLATLMVNLDAKQYNDILVSLIEDHMKRLHLHMFSERFIESIN